MGSVRETSAIIRRNFGPSSATTKLMIAVTLRRWWNRATCALDHVFFPGFRRRRIERPVFVLGNPRSGTTLMHRFLDGSPELAGFHLWEMLVPALTSRRLLRGLVPALERRFTQTPELAAIHTTGPSYAETDDAYLLLSHLDGPLYWAGVCAWDEGFADRIVAPEFLEAAEERLYPLLEGAWRRNLHASGKPRILVKSSLTTATIPGLLRRYPDARLLYMMRSPLQVIPSMLSLLDHNYAHRLAAIRPPSEAQLARFHETGYRLACELYRRFHAEHAGGEIPASQLHIVSYKALMRDFEGEIRAALAAIEVDAAPLAGPIAEIAGRQRGRQSKHRYTLEQYGLSEAQLRRDLACIFDNYDVE
ncbi:MAG: sulfotransferase [Myxococcales bacterium]|nr:sulfotransferase [Myxococcales bacterium]